MKLGGKMFFEAIIFPARRDWFTINFAVAKLVVIKKPVVKKVGPFQLPFNFTIEKLGGKGEKGPTFDKTFDDAERIASCRNNCSVVF